jgi:hypothetical protein
MVLFKTNSMKQSFLLLLLFFCLVLPVDGQNLVPNFSFEEYTDCPTTEDQVEFATGWSKYSTNSINSTPDYFNSCAPSNGPGVPENYLFYQLDPRNCSAYMGLATWNASFLNYREQIGIELSQPLEIGQRYFLSFNTVMGGIISGADYIDSPSNNIGLRLSTVAYSPSNPVPIDNYAHLRSQTIITDTLNWVRISGDIVADSAYSYLMLGNFYEDALTDTITLGCGICSNLGSYYLIDDVCVSVDSTLCNGGLDQLPCLVSIEENTQYEAFTVYPNPATDNIIVQTKSYNFFDVEVYNSVGQLLFVKQKVNSNMFKLNISTYNKGVFFIKINTSDKQITYKLFKQ